MYNKFIALILLNCLILSVSAMEQTKPPFINLPAEIKDETLKYIVLSAENIAELAEAKGAVKALALVSHRYKRPCNTGQTRKAYAIQKQELDNYQNIENSAFYNKLKTKLKNEKKNALIHYFNDITIKDDLITLFKDLANKMPDVQFITFDCNAIDTILDKKIIDSIDKNFNYGLDKYTFQIDYLKKGIEDNCSSYFEHKLFNQTSGSISRSHYCSYDRRNNNDYTPHSHILSLDQTLQEIEGGALSLNEEPKAKKQKTETHSQE